MNARHSKATKRWGTDSDIVERARRVMGTIDLDPCTESCFEPVVRATKNYSWLERREDGLILPWGGNVLCNPPGGLVREFWRHALGQPIDQMIWIGFSMEQLNLLADESSHPVDHIICILRNRIDFKRHDGYQGSPSHGNYIVGVDTDRERFVREFSPLGKVKF